MGTDSAPAPEVLGRFCRTPGGAHQVSDRDARWLRLHRLLHHGILNHLQVLAGWLQMERPDRAREYLAGVVEALVRDAAVLRYPPSVALALLAAADQADHQGVRLTWEAGDLIISPPPLAADRLYELLSEAVDQVATGPAPALHIRIGETPAGPAVSIAGTGLDTSERLSALAVAVGRAGLIAALTADPILEAE